MSFWNHRVMEFVDPAEGPWFSIHEVHYADDGAPEAYTENPVAVCGDSVEELRVTLQRMLVALDRPALVEVDFRREVPPPPPVKEHP